MRLLFFQLSSIQRKITKKTGSFLLILLMFSGCTKKNNLVRSEEGTVSQSSSHKSKGINSVSVTTFPANTISSVAANAGGNVVSGTGNGNGISRGICYHTTPGPTTAHSTVPGGLGSGSFTCTLSGLIPGTLYYVRAYAIKNSITYYGNEISFTTLPVSGTVTDIDGNVYNTITIGTQTWMLENLETTRYRDGSSIPHVTDNAEWAGLTSGAFCDYNNVPAHSLDYGKIYNIYAADDLRNLAPEGWHVPTLTEWNTLFNFLGGKSMAGGKLKEAGLMHWLAPNSAADNGSGFTALPGGVRGMNGNFFGLGTMGYFLEKTSWSPIYHPIVNYNNGEITGGGVITKRMGGSVRCIKD